MPLYINSKKVVKIKPEIGDFVATFPHFREGANDLRNLSCQSVGCERLVYVCQREYAVVCPDDEKVDVIGSEDATTCHIVVIRHSGSGVTGLAHCDGVQTSTFLNGLITAVLQKSKGSPDGRLEAHVIGGFIDDRHESIKLTNELLECLINHAEPIHLLTACITDLNDVIRQNTVHFPAIYGVAVEVKTGQIFPATFPDKGPDMDIRGALCFAGYTEIHNIYDCDRKQLVIGPYDWGPVYHIDVYVNLPDSYIRKYLSTSPAQEPPHFEDHVRTSLKLLQQNPNPADTLFKDGLPYRYSKDANGQWVKLRQEEQHSQQVTDPLHGQNSHQGANSAKCHQGGGDA